MVLLSLLQAFRAKAKAQGVVFIQDPVVGLEVERRRVQRALLKGGDGLKEARFPERRRAEGGRRSRVGRELNLFW